MVNLSNTHQEIGSIVYRRLIDFYGEAKWENKLPPIDELVSTILSQNTNDTNRDKGFNALKSAYGSWEAVRDAPVEEIVAAIRPAGLANQKGPRIQSVLREVTALQGELNIDFLKTISPQEARKWLIQFKGVGPKTAAIVLQYSLDIPAFAVDTHVFRIIKRIGLISEKTTANKAHDLSENIFSPKSFYALHIYMISLGREICHARTPKCEICPLNDICDYYKILSEPKSPQ
jgi:endonuclease III